MLRRYGLHTVAGRLKEASIDSKVLFSEAQNERPSAGEQALFWHLYGDDAGSLDALYGTNYVEQWAVEA